MIMEKPSVYEFERENTLKLLTGFNNNIRELEKEKNQTIKVHILRHKLFDVDDCFEIQWPNERVPVEQFIVKEIDFGTTYDHDFKTDIIYKCIRLKNGLLPRSKKTTIISHTSIINSKKFKKI